MAAPNGKAVDIKFNHPQWCAWQAIAERRTIFYGWGRGVGKSWWLRAAWWLHVAKWDSKLRPGALKPVRGVRVVVIMPTLTQFKDVHWSGIENELTGDREWAWLGARVDRQRGQVIFPGGSWVKPFPANAYNARTARGMRADILSGDEIDDIDAEVYDSIAIPWLSEPWSLGIELLGGTPTRGRHGLWFRLRESGRLGEKLRDGKVSSSDALELPAAQAVREIFSSLPADEWPASLPRDPDEATLHVLRGYYAFHATYRDAPETVSPIAVARAKATTPTATFAREWLADPDSAEGLVYPFDERFHVIGGEVCPFQQLPPLTRFTEFLVGMDFGWVDAGVLVLIGIIGHGNDAVAIALEEWYESECPAHVWDERAKAWNFATFWPDPSQPERINTLRSFGLQVRDLPAESKPILAGVSRVADMLFRRTAENAPDWCRFYVSPACKNLIREFGLYRRKKLPDGSFDEMPEDKNNHSMDATRYALSGRFGRPTNYRHTASGR